MSLPPTSAAPVSTLSARVFGRARGGSLLVLFVAGCLVAGCQAPPARPAGCDADDALLGRKGVLARQLAVDTAVAGATEPVRSGYNVGSELGGDLRAFA